MYVSHSFAQCNNALDGFGIEANLLAGKVVKHSNKFTSPSPALSSAVDVNFVWQTYGKKDWHQRRNFPIIGVGINYTDYGINDVYGNCIGIYPNLQLRLLRREKLEWDLRLGNGLAYVTKKYQATEPYDTLNVAIGTNFNDFGIVMTDLRYHINKNWHVQIGANFTHISNGDYRQPNLGVNMVGLHAGVQYYPVSCHPKPIIKDLPKLKNRWLAEISMSVGYKEARAKGNPILPKYIGSVQVSKRWLGKNKFFVGADYAYHNDVHAFLINYGVNYGEEKQHSWDGTFFAGNEFLVGRVGLLMQLGVYYHQTFLKFDAVNEKFGINYYLIHAEHGPVKELFLCARLITHEAVAEYSCFGIGMGF